jgi:hypothetical protein
VNIHPRRAFLVIGGHRCGTSAVAGLLHHTGAQLPSHLEPANRFNESGYFESSTLMRFNDRILSEAESSWRDWGSFSEAQQRALFAPENEDELAELLAGEFSDSPRFVVKDPRISRLAPLYLAALRRLQADPMVVIVLREPMESAQSLMARDDMLIAEGLLLWLRYQLEAERFTRGCQRMVVSYAELLRNWRKQCSRVATAFHLGSLADPAMETALDAFISPQLRHHDSDLAAPDPALQDWLSACSGALRRLARDPRAEQPLRRLDKLRHSMDTIAQPFASISRQLIASHAQIRELQQRRREKERGNTPSAHEAQETLTATPDELAAARLDAAQLRNMIEALKAQLAVQTQDARSLRRKLADAERRLAFRTEFGGSERMEACLIAASDMFDAQWYLSTYPDVRESGADPAYHYLRHGAAEGRDPSPRFSTRNHVSLHPELAGAGINPLVHYILVNPPRAGQSHSAQLQAPIDANA